MLPVAFEVEAGKPAAAFEGVLCADSFSFVAMPNSLSGAQVSSPSCASAFP